MTESQEPERAQETSPADLAYRIEAEHHAYLERALPRVAATLERCARERDAPPPWLGCVRIAFGAFRNGIEAVSYREERVVFPAIRRLVHGARADAALSREIAALRSACGTLRGLLAQIRSATGGFAVPDGASTAVRDLLGALSSLEADVARHFEREFDGLYPMVAAAGGAAERISSGPPRVPAGRTPGS